MKLIWLADRSLYYILDPGLQSDIMHLQGIFALVQRFDLSLYLPLKEKMGKLEARFLWLCCCHYVDFQKTSVMSTFIPCWQKVTYAMGLLCTGGTPIFNWTDIVLTDSRLCSFLLESFLIKVDCFGHCGIWPNFCYENEMVWGDLKTRTQIHQKFTVQRSEKYF